MIILLEAAVRRCSAKKFLKPLQNSQENTYARAPFLNLTQCTFQYPLKRSENLKWANELTG